MQEEILHLLGLNYRQALIKHSLLSYGENPGDVNSRKRAKIMRHLGCVQRQKGF
jgi:hypothetical protein